SGRPLTPATPAISWDRTLPVSHLSSNFRLSTASAELRCVAWTRQSRAERWPWRPSHWSFHRPLPSALPFRPRCHFPQATARLRAVSQQPAVASRSACPAACTAPACGATPHGYPSYVPLRLTLGLDKDKVNGKAIRSRYPGNGRRG